MKGKASLAAALTPVSHAVRVSAEGVASVTEPRLLALA